MSSVELTLAEEIRDTLLDKGHKESDVYDMLSNSKEISRVLLEHTPKKPWNPDDLCKRDGFHFDLIRKAPNLRWRSSAIVNNISIRINELVKDYGFGFDVVKMAPHVDWWSDYFIGSIAKLEGCTLEFVEKYSDKNWWWTDVMELPGFDFKFVKRHPHKHWAWQNVSRLQDFDIEFVKEYPDKKWDWIHVLEIGKDRLDLSEIMKHGNFRHGNSEKRGRVIDEIYCSMLLKRKRSKSL